MATERQSLKNADLPRGVMRTADGHLRYTSPKEKRGKYVHRERAEEMIKATPYSIRLLLPWPYEVHHQDYNKEHNCGCNLLLVSEALHSAMTAHRKRRGDGRFQPKWISPAPWTLFDEKIAALSEVPF